MTFPRYPNYKESGIEWLGQVPDHWDVVPLRWHCSVMPSNVDKKSYDGELPIRLCNYTDVYYNDRITDGLPFMAATATPDQVSRFSLRAGDVIVTKDSETADDIAVGALVSEDLPGVVCGYHLALLRPKDKRGGRFLKYLFDATTTKEYVATRANGLTRVGLSQNALNSMPTVVPPIEDQLAIAGFLDRETAKIDALVAEQERLISLLKEKRQAVISHAVTKGLNPAAPIKYHGTDCVAAIPEHWQVMALNRLIRRGTTITYGIVQAGPDVEGGVPYIRTSDMSGDSLREGEYLRTSYEIDRSYSRSKVEEGELVVAIRASVGKALIVPRFLHGANLTQGTARVSPGDRVKAEYLALFFRSELCQGLIQQVSKGTTFQEITLDALRKLPIIVPPMHEQLEIVDRIKEQIGVIDSLQKESESVVEILAERRSALITAAVTGQIDVRGLAPAEAA